MSIKITSSQEFEKLLDGLSTDLIRSIHFREIFLAVQKEIPNSPTVFAQSNTFWWHTMTALADSSLHCLGRVYDTQPAALSLPNLLKLISENLHYFSEENFRTRLSGNAFVESLADFPRTPDKAQLVQDTVLVSPKDPLVNKLIVWRNNLYGHRSSSSALESFKNLAPFELTWEEVKELSERALTIYNHYQSLFKANSWSSMLVGGDDFLSLLRFAQAGLDQYERSMGSEIARHVVEDPPAHA